MKTVVVKVMDETGKIVTKSGMVSVIVDLRAGFVSEADAIWISGSPQKEMVSPARDYKVFFSESMPGGFYPNQIKILK